MTGSASAFSLCTGVHIDVTKRGLEPVTQVATFGDVVDWHMRSPYPATTIVFDDGSCSVTFNAWPDVVGGLAIRGCWPSSPGTYAYSVTGLWTGGGTIVVEPPPLQALPNPVVYGDSAALAGEVPTQIDCSGGPLGWTPPVIQVQATLLARAYGQEELSPFGTVTATGARGDFATLVTPTIETTYEARLGELTTATATVRVRPRVELRRTSSHRFAVSASAGHSLAGARVRVRVDGRTVRTLALDSAGRARFVLRGPGRMRVFMPAAEAGPGYVAGFSRTLKLEP